MNFYRSVIAKAVRRGPIIVVLIVCLFAYRFFAQYWEAQRTITSFPIKPFNPAQDDPESHSPLNLTTTIVVSSTYWNNIKWLNKIRIPQLTIIRYVADDPKAQYHPPKNKGKEATMYFTYLHDNYNNLDDITIFIHAEDLAWHSETLLNDSMKTTLNQLDISAIHARGYANLRVGWGPGCPDWISTNPTEQDLQRAPESASMGQAFSENFPRDKEGNTIPVPPFLAQPCCSQIALSRAKAQSIPRSTYAFHRDWLLDTKLSDSIAGRAWEHLFQYLFTGKAVDCPIEWKTYCAMYRMCFDGEEQVEEFHNLKYERKDLFETKLNFFKAIISPWEARSAWRRVKKIDARMAELRHYAWNRGRDDSIRNGIVGDSNRDLYVD